MKDLQSFLEAHQAEHLHIRKPVKLEDVGALTAQSTQTIVFEKLVGFPDFRLVDLFFSTGRRRPGCLAAIRRRS